MAINDMDLADVHTVIDDYISDLQASLEKEMQK